MSVTPTEAIDPWLDVLWDRGGTDLLLTTNSPPRVRVDGALRPIDGAAVLDGQSIAEITNTLLNEELIESFETRKDVDFSFSWKGRARIRGNAFTQKGDVALALRMIPSKIPSFDELGLPPAATWLANLPRGFVLVTGPTGSGKSTTLASIIDFINETRALHILTIEDPIEYVHPHKMSAVNQREIGTDSGSFERALRSALREDPDVLLVGEMRDLETIQIALTMAETGHLVFATLHTNDASQAIDRIIDVFPAWRQDQIRVQLSASLAAVVAQRLIPRVDGGMVAAFEVLVANNATRNLIREGKTNQLRNTMTTSQGEGMKTLEMSLGELISSGQITYEGALGVSGYPKELRAHDDARRRSTVVAMRRGSAASLPYQVVASAIPCPGGWLVASAKVHGVTIAPEEPRVLSSFVAVLDEKPAFAAIALSAPIAVLDQAEPGGRPCDRDARALLGPRRGAAMRSAPTLTNFENAGDEQFIGLDAVTRRLLPKFREVAAEMAPYLQRTVYEVHPELSFFELNGDRPLQYSKRFEIGRAERRALLESKIPGVERIIDAEVPGVTEGHLLDAAACMWTARRILARAAIRLPRDPEWNSQGLRSEFVR